MTPVDATERRSPATLEAFQRKRTQVVDAFQELDRIAGDLGASSLKRTIGQGLVRKLEEDRFHLVVVGEFNHGKTTLMNALLGRAILPVGVTPTTATIHHIRWATAPEAFVVSTRGERRALPFDDIKRFATGGNQPLDEVDHLEIGYPAPLLTEEIVLVDTPGVNDLSLQRADVTYNYIPRADAVLFLLDAGQLLTESERVFLNDKLLKGSRDKIIFVVTKWDLLSPAEQTEALDYARSRLSSLVRNPVVFPVGAEAALAGSSDGGLPQLVAYLKRFLAEERGNILLDNALGEGLRAAGLLLKGMDAKRRGIHMSGEEIDRRIAALEGDLAGHAETIEQRRIKVREDISGIKTGAQRDLDRFVDDVCRQLPNVVDSARAEDLGRFLPSFLEDAFRQWAEAETHEIAGLLEKLTEATVALVREDARDSARRVATALGSETRPVDVHIDTIKYDVGVVALMFGGVALMAVNVMAGGLLAVAGPAVFAMFARTKIHEELRARAKEVAPQAIRDAAKQVSPKLDAMIDDFAKNLDAWIVGAGEELHREILEVLRATRRERGDGHPDRAEELARLEAQARALEQATHRLQELRREFAPAPASAA